MIKGDILGTYFDSNAAAFQRGLQYHSVLALLDQLQGGAVLAAGHRAVLDRDLDVVAGLHHEASLRAVRERAAGPGAPQAHAAIRPVLDRHVGGRARPGLGGREKHHRRVEVDSRPPRLKGLSTL